MTVQIRTMELGTNTYGDSDFAQVVLDPSQLIYLKMHQLLQMLNFPSPIYLEPDNEYCCCLTNLLITMSMDFKNG